MNWPLRLAKEEDAEELEALIALSVRGLQGGHYSPEQMEASLGPVFGVDRQLIRDGTYWVVEDEGRMVGCGGWSFRKKIYGGEGHQLGQEGMLDPARDAARVRAFFVHPDWARRSIGRSLLLACEQAAMEAGFRRAEMVATLTGEALYAACGYAVLAREEAPIPGGWTLPVVRMGKMLRA
jgi:GNAT superfamily N-acetyltransferase